MRTPRPPQLSETPATFTCPLSRIAPLAPLTRFSPIPRLIRLAAIARKARRSTRP